MLPGREPKIKGYILIILNSLNILIEELIVDLQSILILNATYSNLLLNPHILQHSVYSESLKQFYLSQLMICAPAYSYPSPFFFPFSNNDSLFNQEISFPLKNSEETHNNLTTMNCTNTTEETKTLELEISESIISTL